MKRLEDGCFACLWREDTGSLQLTPSELALFVEGCKLVGRESLSPEERTPIPAALKSPR
jgi:hypothetical protein